ncbi:MAG TPA: Clp protease N-terminal domain-containing protein [Acidimicrobiales bacterium]|nr:Clp protease N-terminal domain-containing protein [Acidimicrobiales bacterium]
MKGRFSDASASVVNQARKEAHRIGSPAVGTEHLLLGLLVDQGNRAAQALLDAGATRDGCRSKVAELVGPPAAQPTGGQLDYTDRARRTLDRADRLALRLRTAHVEPEHILVSLLDVEGRAGQVLRGLGVDVAMLRGAAAGDATAGGGGTTAVSESGARVEETSTSGPRCTGCGSDLAVDGLAHRVVASRNAEGRTRDFVVVYCSACGVSIGATPVPVRPSGTAGR